MVFRASMPSRPRASAKVHADSRPMPQQNDLKKQTAMRLAQEQDQHRPGGRQQQSSYNNNRSHNQHMQEPQAHKSQGSGQHQYNRRPGSHESSPHLQPYNYQNCFQQTPSIEDTSVKSYQTQFGSPVYQGQQNTPQRSKIRIQAQQQQQHSIQRLSPQPPLQTPQRSTPQKWQSDMISETSSVRSYEYDCNASVTSTLSGSSNHYTQQARISSLSVASAIVTGGGEIMPSPSRPSQNQGDHSRHRQIAPQNDGLGAVSSVISKNSKEGVGSGPSTTIMSSSNPRSSQDKARQKKTFRQKEGYIQTHSGPTLNQQHSQIYSPRHNPRQTQESHFHSPHSNTRNQSAQNTPTHSFHPTPKNKLPHGLTVEELKEMTRARLAAEAAAENQARQQQHPQPLITTPKEAQLFPNPHSAMRGRAQTCPDEVFRQTRHNVNVRSSSDSTLPNQPVATSPHPWQRLQHAPHMNYSAHRQQGQGPMQASNMYLSPTKQNFESSFNQEPGHHPQYLDATETTSVTSYNSTFGNESARMNHSSQPPSNENTSMSVGRSWSFPSGNANDNPTDTPKSSTSLYEYSSGLGSIGGCRRRIGASPPGFHLEVAHEDRPLTVSDDLSLPLFETPNTSKWNPVIDDSSALSSCPSPAHSERFQRGRHLTDDSGDRIPSPPSETSKPLNMDEGQELVLPPLLFNESHRASSGMSNDLPSWVAESVLIAPQIEGRKVIAQKANDEFFTKPRCSSDGGAAGSLLGDLLKRNPHGNHRYNEVFRSDGNAGVEIHGTNSDGFLFPEISMLGQHGLNNTDSGSWGNMNVPKQRSVATIMSMTDHFGSLLSLNPDKKSSAEDTITHPSEFVSRIDPEVEPRSIIPTASRPAALVFQSETNHSVQTHDPLPQAKLHATSRLTNHKNCKKREKYSRPMN